MKTLKCNECGITEGDFPNKIPGVKIGCLMCNGEMIPEYTGKSVIDAANATSDESQE